MSAEISIFDLFLQASLLVKSVMIILLGFSISCWAMIFQRRKVLNDAQAQMKNFEDKFWSGADLSKLYNEVSSKGPVTGIESLFVSGFKEFARLRKSNQDSPQAIVDGTHRAMRVALSREVVSWFGFWRCLGNTKKKNGIVNFSKMTALQIEQRNRRCEVT